MNSDFLCEKRLAKLSPEYNALTKNTAFIMFNALDKYKTFFWDYTDHSILHSLQVLDFCNRLIGENVNSLNEDELYILIMGAYLHDFGMGISEKDYYSLCESVAGNEYLKTHPGDEKETIRAFHQKFSRKLIYKYASLFEFPSEAHTEAIALISEGHRKIDLYDENIIPAVMTMPDGNPVHLPYLAALIRLADELDIAADRNLGTGDEVKDNIFRLMHRSIKHLHTYPDKFVLDVEADDPALFADISKEISKLEYTLRVCADVVKKRTPFTITQNSVVINRLVHDKRRIMVLDTDVGTDDACALLLLNNLPHQPDYIVTSYGNASSEGACRNAIILKKRLGLTAEIVTGLPAPEGTEKFLAEKNTFHGPDGIAGCAAKMTEDLKLTEADFRDYITFDDFRKRLEDVDAVTYITIGPITNLVSLFDDKKIRPKLAGMYVMGGGIREFNCSHDTEFNFSKNPEGVRKLLTAGLNITLFPLDVTNHQTLTSDDIDELEKTGKYPEWITMLRQNLKSNAEFNGINAAVIHDGVPVLYLAHPELYELDDMRMYADEYGHTEHSKEGAFVHICVGAREGIVRDYVKKAFGC